MHSRGALYPFLVTLVAIGLLSLMDSYMKAASIAVGAFSALVVRSLLSSGLTIPLWLWKGPGWPEKHVLRLHVIRGVNSAIMALTFFWALVYLPLAEAIALAFISPVIALGLAAVILKEKIAGKAITAAMLSLLGVVIIVGGRIGRETMSDEAALGVVMVLLSAAFYAWNLILQRQQALVAKPLEIVTFQNVTVALVLLLGTPFFFRMPQGDAWIDIGMATLLALVAAPMMAWAYARAEAQVLVPVEYTGFAWAALFGWIFFGEEVRLTTIAGAALIIVGCWIAAPRKHTEQVATGVASPAEPRP
jgi:S-adenosylmethionine uptake transporter